MTPMRMSERRTTFLGAFLTHVLGDSLASRALGAGNDLRGLHRTAQRT